MSQGLPREGGGGGCGIVKARIESCIKNVVYPWRSKKISQNLLMDIFHHDNVVDSSSHPSDIIFSGFDVAKTGDARIGFVGK